MFPRVQGRGSTRIDSGSSMFRFLIVGGLGHGGGDCRVCRACEVMGCSGRGVGVSLEGLTTIAVFRVMVEGGFATRIDFGKVAGWEDWGFRAYLLQMHHHRMRKSLMRGMRSASMFLIDPGSQV